MNFTIARQPLMKELGLLQGVVEKKSTIPILSNLLLNAREGGIEIKATDLDVSISTFCEAEVRQPGSICLPAKKFFEIVRSLPEAEVEIRKGENEQVTVRCERSNFKLLGVSADNYPEIKGFDGGGLSLPSDLFRLLISRTIFAVTNDESRYTLNGAKLEISSTGVRMVSTDGHRLSFMEKQLPLESARLDVLIPKKTLAELSKLSAESDDPIETGSHDNHIFFKFGRRLLVSRTLSGQFPNYEMVLPKENNHRLTIESAPLASALRRVALMADERSHGIRLDLHENELQITSQSADAGEAGETLSVDYQGAPMAIGFNANYLLDFFTVVGEGEVSLEFKDGNSQVQLRPKGEVDYDYRYIVMPMRV